MLGNLSLKLIWNYFCANFRLMWINTIEYKSNFYMNLFQLIIFSVIQIFSFYLISYAFSDYVGWDVADFYLFYVLIYFISTLSGFFSWGKDLFYVLSDGTLNIYLTKPVGSFIGYLFSVLSGWALMSFTFRIIVFIFIYLYFSIEIYNLFLFLFALFLVSLLLLVIYQLIQSFEFIALKMSYSLENYWNIYDIFMAYPAPLFKGFPIQLFLYFFPSFFVGYLLVPLLRGYEIWRLDLQIFILVFLIIFCCIGIFLNWKYGLKKYEAFG